ncbi:conserved hypothetical protein [Burkholderia pseudomallei MSHR346]|nr:hypothetical protein BURPS668_A1010 [Burkholderia pseudomallei 668]EEP49468.1 conserved hypothetical protein [Burkholderia pseudomallei MSHR346]
MRPGRTTPGTTHRRLDRRRTFPPSRRIISTTAFAQQANAVLYRRRKDRSPYSRHRRAPRECGATRAGIRPR